MKTNIRNILFVVIGILLMACGEKNKTNEIVQDFSFDNNHWRIVNLNGSLDSIKIVSHQGRESIFLEQGQKAFLKDVKFKNFIAEFYSNGQVPGIGFRVQDIKNYDYLYLRMMMSEKRDALQYVPIHNGNLPWQLYNYPKYEGMAVYPRREITVLPLSIESQLVAGAASSSLLSALEKKGVIFSEKSFVDIPTESPAYIYDPKSNESLIFEKRGSGIAFLDVRAWIHVKVEVIEDKLSVYVDDMDSPTFVVDDLKTEQLEGGISLYSNFGGVYFNDFSISEIEELEKKDVHYDSKQVSKNYITEWRMSEMFTKDSVGLLKQVDSLLVQKDSFIKIKADKDGLVNISRFYDNMDQTVVLTTEITSDSDKEVTLNFDYADHLVLLMNSEILFDGGMNFRPPSDKGTEGRVFVDDEETVLRLRKGVNSLVFVLSGDNRQKYNWGAIAKLESLDGLTLE